jgi:ATP-dependent DNA helicase PIF1
MDALNEGQRRAADTVIEGSSCFITGPGGVGKSFLLQTLHDVYAASQKTLAITAMTGCAALLIGPYAKTLHSWAGIGLGRGNPEVIIEAIINDGKRKKRWRQTDCLVIDEVSMLTPGLMDLLDLVGRRVRKIDQPFGGLQMVFVGDFYQLPPVSKEIGPATSFAFMSPLWPKKTVQLTQILRQKDPVFQQILNEARTGDLSPESYATLESRKTMDWKRQEIKPTLLFTKNNDVNAINENQLAKLPGEVHSFQATTSSHPKMPAQAVQWAVEKLDRDASYEVTLKLKVRAQVMLLKQPFRDDTDKNGKPTRCPIEGLVNGSRGIITEFAYDGYPMVKFLNGPPYPVKIIPTNWDSDAEKPEEKVSREQIPLRLAYALTIHKAQGASLDSALIDVGPSTFEYGQAYVALSRVKSMDSLFIHNFSSEAFHLHKKVAAFYGLPC